MSIIIIMGSKSNTALHSSFSGYTIIHLSYSIINEVSNQECAPGPTMFCSIGKCTT